MHYNSLQMRSFEFSMSLSADKTRAIYEGRARYIVVEADGGLKLQLPASNFRRYVVKDGIRGRFSVSIDADNRIVSLRRI